MSFSRRLMKELHDIQSAKLPYFCNIKANDSNLLVWHGLILPSNPPYHKGAFLVELAFPEDYPFKPPQVTFKTKIYHPNIGEDGRICLALLTPENWKPATRVEQVVEATVALVNSPQPDHPLRPDLAEEYVKNKKKFLKTAEEFTSNNAEKRPKHA